MFSLQSSLHNMCCILVNLIYNLVPKQSCTKANPGFAALCRMKLPTTAAGCCLHSCRLANANASLGSVQIHPGSVQIHPRTDWFPRVFSFSYDCPATCWMPVHVHSPHCYTFGHNFACAFHLLRNIIVLNIRLLVKSCLSHAFAVRGIAGARCHHTPIRTYVERLGF